MERPSRSRRVTHRLSPGLAWSMSSASAGLLQPVVLPCCVLIGGGDAGVAEDVARPSNDRFRDGFRHGPSAALPGPGTVSLSVPH